ncbi:MAG TPA: hypothetical protein VEY30_12665 [Myxococcaceae bacterium]|nr:hypothetical protein [Myxococcaceae bacterium]
MKAVKRKYTVMLPEALVQEAQAATQQPLTPLIERGLQLVAREGAYERLRALRGRVKFSIDFKLLREDDA